jgi:prepilin-type N-terminal cleavage/methylation domain-containing protein
MNGFTLIELLIVMAVVSVLAVPTTLVLFNFRVEQNLQSDARIILTILRDAQQRSVTQEDDEQWGVHFQDNPPGQVDYYELFKNNASQPALRRRLSVGIQFSAVLGDMIFARITGLPNITGDISITNTLGSVKTITIQSNGALLVLP